MVDRMLRQNKNTKIEESKKKSPLKIVYMRDIDKQQYEVVDNDPEARRNSFPVAPSYYASGSKNYKITDEDLKNYPQLQPIACRGDIVSQEEFDNFVGK